MTPLAEIDKRTYPRPSFAKKIKVNLSHAELININNTGICFSLKQSLSKNEIIDVTIFNSNYKGRILWVNTIKEPFIYGASLNLSPEEETALLKKIVSCTYKKIAVKTKNKEKRVKILEFSKKLIGYINELNSFNLKKKLVTEEQLISLNNSIVEAGEKLRVHLNDKTLIEVIKNEFRTLVGVWAFKSQIMKRSFEKPKGYPGDYQTLETIYDRMSYTHDQNDLGYLFDQYFLTNPYANAVRNRKDILKKHVLRILNSERSEIKILNLACGSSREVREIFSSDQSSIRTKKIQFNLLDWDDEALAFTRESIESLHLKDNITIKYLKEDLLQFIRNNSFFSLSGRQDLIYSIGLADYLPDRVMKKLIKIAFDGLNVGGELILAHKDREITFSHLPPEWFCDWIFIPRNEQEFLSLITENELKNYSFETERDDTRDIFFYIIKKCQ